MTFLVGLVTWTSAQANNQPAGRAPEATWKTARPRLFFTAEKLKRLRQRIAKGGAFRDAWSRILSRANRELYEKLVSKKYAESGTGQHGNYGPPSSQISEMAGTLGLAYQMTGDKRYAAKLRDALIYYGDLHRWAGDAHNKPPWHSELNTARFCYGYAVGYDSIYDFLSKDERKTIAEAMIRSGILPTLDDWILGEKRIHALDSMGHNWWSVCVSMAGLAALSLVGDEPQVEPWVQQVSEAFPQWFGYQGNVLQNKSINFDRKGGFYEGVNYANYALSQYLLFRLAFTNVFGQSSAPDIPLLRKVGDFFVQTCYPAADSMLSVNFGDSSLHSTGAETVRLLLANGYDAPQYDWYLIRTDPGLDDPVGLVYYELRPKPSLPKDFAPSILYPDIGWAILRSSWDDDATMLAVKSGFAWNHAHPDAGSFILFHAGKPLIIDSGTCSYSRHEYSTYYRQSKAHNVVLIDGQAQNPEAIGRGTVTPGQIPRLIDAAGLKYVFADATEPTAWKFSRNYRHFLWLGDAILIFDDVRTHQEGQLEWLLHYQDTAQMQGRQILLSNGDARVIVQPLFPEEMNIVQKKGLKDHQPDVKVTYLAFAPEGKRRECKFVTAILPLDAGDEKPAVKIERLKGNEAIGVRLSEADTVTDVYLNLQADGRMMHRNSCNVINGWDTDAYLFAVTRPKAADKNDPDSVSRYFVACGSYLRRNGKVVLDSLSKVYTVFVPGKRMDVWLQGQPVTNVFLRAPAEPDTVVLNSKNAPVHYDEAAHGIRVGTNPFP
jgi:oligo-alginate lyase